MLAPVMMAMIASAPMLAVFSAQMTPTTVAAPYPAAMAQSRARRRRHAIAVNGIQVSRLNDDSGLLPSATGTAASADGGPGASQPKIVDLGHPLSLLGSRCGARHQRNCARR